MPKNTPADILIAAASTVGLLSATIAGRGSVAQPNQPPLTSAYPTLFKVMAVSAADSGNVE